MGDRQQEIDAAIIEDKQLRQWLDTTLQKLKAMDHKSRERSLAKIQEAMRSLAATKIQEAIMWLGMDLKELAGGVSCYKHGYDPQSTKVDPPPDGVKL